MKLFFTLFILVTAFTCVAQKPANEKAQNYYYYKKDGFTEVSTKDSAEYIEIITEPDKGEKLFDVKRFYKNGNIRFMGKSANVHPIFLEGQAASYYPNGTKNQVTNYKHNRPEGETYSYYPNGKKWIIMEFLPVDLTPNKKHIARKDSLLKFEYDSLGNPMVQNGQGYFKFYDADDFNTVSEEGPIKDFRPDGLWKGQDVSRKIKFTENFKDGHLVDGHSTDSAGNHYTYKERTLLPRYKNGEELFRKNAGIWLRYPAFSREANHQGTVIIRVLVEKDGKVSQYQVLQSVDKYMDEEALRVIKVFAKFEPAEFYGIKEACWTDIPITYTLRER